MRTHQLFIGTFMRPGGVGVWVLVLVAHNMLTAAASLGDAGTTSGAISVVDDERFRWGTYRGNLYFGTRMTHPLSPMTGMMWLGRRADGSWSSMRHECNMEDKLSRWGWIEHDGISYGKEVLVDDQNNLNMTVVFHKAHARSWEAVITADPIDPARPMDVSLLYYLTYGGPSYEFQSEHSGSVFAIAGYTPETGRFAMGFDTNDQDLKLGVMGVVVPPTDQWRLKGNQFGVRNVPADKG